MKRYSVAVMTALSVGFVLFLELAGSSLHPFEVSLLLALLLGGWIVAIRARLRTG
jgi:hypothetical protein